MPTPDFRYATIVDVDPHTMTARWLETGDSLAIVSLETTDGDPAVWESAHFMVLSSGDGPEDFAIYVPLTAVAAGNIH